MVTKKRTTRQTALSKKCDAQLASLYAYFGKLLYENSQKHTLHFRFKPQHRDLEEKTGQILETMASCPQERYYELFKVASTNLLKDEEVTLAEKIQILKNLFSKAPYKAVNFLFEMVKNADLFLKKNLMNLLKKVDSPMLINLYRKCIVDTDSFLRIRGIIGLSMFDSDEAKELILSAASDPNSQVRRLVVSCLDCHGDDPEVAMIIKLTNDENENVARIAIRKLGRAKIHLSVVHLITKLESPNIKIRKEAIEALRFMAGTDLGYWYSAAESNRKASIEEWKKLWQRYQANPHFLQEIKSKVLPNKQNQNLS